MVFDVYGIRQLRSLCLVTVAAALTGCAASTTAKYDDIDAIQAETEVPEAALLDVGIMLFDPGVPEDQQDPDGFIFPDVRRAEARFMPYHLKRTLESTGLWGSVWVVPEHSDAVDLIIWGRVDRSDGLEVELRVGAWDSTGKEWLNKKYKSRDLHSITSLIPDLDQT